jgi:hypothetical protein
MLTSTGSHTSANRRGVLDRLRSERELGMTLVLSDADARMVLEEVDLLEVVGGLADRLLWLAQGQQRSGSGRGCSTTHCFAGGTSRRDCVGRSVDSRYPVRNSMVRRHGVCMT